MIIPNFNSCYSSSSSTCKKVHFSCISLQVASGGSSSQYQPLAGVAMDVAPGNLISRGSAHLIHFWLPFFFQARPFPVSVALCGPVFSPPLLCECSDRLLAGTWVVRRFWGGSACPAVRRSAQQGNNSRRYCCFARSHSKKRPALPAFYSKLQIYWDWEGGFLGGKFVLMPKVTLLATV